MNDENLPPGQQLVAVRRLNKNKPLMERRRRQRINNCLEELKSMLEALSKKNETSYLSKLEKADILELTVQCIRNLRRSQPQDANSPRNRSSVESYALGYDACMAEVIRCFRSQQTGDNSSVHPAVLTGLLDHLAKRRQVIPQTSDVERCVDDVGSHVTRAEPMQHHRHMVTSQTADRTHFVDQSNPQMTIDYRKFDLHKVQVSPTSTAQSPDFEAATTSSFLLPSPVSDAAAAATDAVNNRTAASGRRLQLTFNGATHFDQTPPVHPPSQRTPLSTLNIDVQRSPRYARGRLTPEAVFVGRYDTDRLRRRVLLPSRTRATALDATDERSFHRVTSSAERRFPSPDSASSSSDMVVENLGDVQRYPVISGDIKKTSFAGRSVHNAADAADETGDALRASLSVTAAVDGVLTSSMWRPW